MCVCVCFNRKLVVKHAKSGFWKCKKKKEKEEKDKL